MPILGIAQTFLQLRNDNWVASEQGMIGSHIIIRYISFGNNANKNHVTRIYIV